MKKALFPHPDRVPKPFLEPRQAGSVPPTEYENGLADAIETAFGAGIVDIDDLIAELNAEGIRTRDGARWTRERFEAELQRLAR